MLISWAAARYTHRIFLLLSSHSASDSLSLSLSLLPFLNICLYCVRSFYFFEFFAVFFSTFFFLPFSNWTQQQSTLTLQIVKSIPLRITAENTQRLSIKNSKSEHFWDIAAYSKEREREKMNEQVRTKHWTLCGSFIESEKNVSAPCIRLCWMCKSISMTFQVIESGKKYNDHQSIKLLVAKCPTSGSKTMSSQHTNLLPKHMRHFMLHIKKKAMKSSSKKKAVPTEEKSVTTATTDRHLFRIAPTVDLPLSYPPWCWRHCWEQNNGNIFTFSMARTPPSSSSNIYTRECVHNF